MITPRCCRDSLTIELAKLRGPFPVGLEIPCRWSSDVWRFDGSEWILQDELKQRIEKMAAEVASPEYQREKNRVLGRTSHE